MATIQEKATAFQELHKGEPFVIPNPWDAGSARVLAALGYEALATTSSGFAFTLGRGDRSVDLEEVVEHVAVVAAATDLPVSVDMENGYGAKPEEAAAAVTAVARAGAVGASIEDYDPSNGIYEMDPAVERVAAAVEAARALDFPFTVTARAENYVHGNPDLDDTIARLQAFERAGADVLYAPCLETIEDIRAICAAVSKPVNVLARRALTRDEIFRAGAQRISIGGQLTWKAVDALTKAARDILERGDFSVLDAAPPPADWLA